MFARRIAVQSGDIVDRDGFVFADLIPSEAAATAAAEPTVDRSRV
jgi:hypothetical protein